jgi:hypothetical protein
MVVLKKLVAALKPGGWLLDEEFDSQSLPPDPAVSPDLGLVVVGRAVRTDPLLFGGSFDPGDGAPMLLADGVTAAAQLDALSAFQRNYIWVTAVDLDRVDALGVDGYLARSARASIELYGARLSLSAPDQVLRAEAIGPSARPAGHPAGASAMALLLGFAAIGAITGATIRPLGSFCAAGAPPGVTALLTAIGARPCRWPPGRTRHDRRLLPGLGRGGGLTTARRSADDRDHAGPRRSWSRCSQVGPGRAGGAGTTPAVPGGLAGGRRHDRGAGPWSPRRRPRRRHHPEPAGAPTRCRWPRRPSPWSAAGCWSGGRLAGHRGAGLAAAPRALAPRLGWSGRCAAQAAAGGSGTVPAQAAPSP